MLLYAGFVVLRALVRVLEKSEREEHERGERLQERRVQSATSSSMEAEEIMTLATVI